VILGTDSEGKALITTTFSSHIARLKSLNDFGKSIGRKVVFLGRSLSRYIEAAEACGITKFKDVEVCKYRKHVAKKLKQMSRDRQKYFIVCTGHQGEPKAVLSRIAREEFDFKLGKEDHIIFSCRTIPNPVNVENRLKLETLLKKTKARIFKDVHVSGHANKEDLREMISLVKPQNIIPCHSDKNKARLFRDFMGEIGYNTNNVHLMRNGKRLKLRA
jgi:ribonuclease J